MKRLFTDSDVSTANARNRAAWAKPVERPHGPVGAGFMTHHYGSGNPVVPDKPVPRRKHGNVPTVAGGIKFDSKHEAQVWTELRLRESAGEIKFLQRQVSFPLTVHTSRIQRWRADFVFWERQPAGGWTWRVADAKSSHTAALPAWRRTKALFESLYGIPVEIL